MLDSITIKNYKAIQSEQGLTLSGLTNVNYLVGKNGCGKSSVLEYLYIDSRFHKFENNHDSLEYNGKQLRIPPFLRKSLTRKSNIKLTSYGNTSNRFEIVFVTFDISYLCNFLNGENQSKHIVSNYLPDKKKKYLDWLYDKNKYSKIEPEEQFISKVFDSIYKQTNYCVLPLIKYHGHYGRKFMHEISISPFPKLKKELINSFINTNSNVEKEFNTNDINIFSRLKESSGTSSYLSFLWCFMELFTYNKNIDKTKKFILCFDEMETNLHPNFQKHLSGLIDIMQKTILESGIDLQIIISTHSPFIISEAAKYPDTQKVYLLEDGQTRDLEGNLGQGQEVYSGGECILAVNQMLGSSIQDVAPHVIIFCERTLKKLIESYKPNPTIILTDKAGGSDDRINVMTDIFDSVRLSDKVNFLNYNIFGVIDQCGKESNWKKQLGEKLIVLNSDELEQLYDIDLINKFLLFKNLPEWNKSIDPKFAENYCKNNQALIVNKGDLKNELATFIGQNTNKEFIKTISQGLYNLIFN
jgi:predicted ATP-dependent endonuclease of OLD family